MFNPSAESNNAGLLSGVLQKTLQGERVSHAYLFTASPATGKATALAFAQALLCEAPTAGEACGLCRSCRLLQRGAHPDFHWVRPEGSSIKIQQIRELQRQVSFRPFHGGRGVTVLEQAEQMTLEAANCLLKTLEEPPPAVHLILLTTRRQALPATICSRCQCLTLETPSPREVNPSFAADPNGPEAAAVFTAPDYGATVSPGGDSAGAADAVAPGREEARRVAAVLARDGALEALAAGEAAAKNREQALDTLAMLLGWYRDLLLWRETKTSGLLFCPAQLPALEAVADQYPVGALVRVIEEIEQTRRNVSGNTNVRLLLESLFLKINQLLK